MTSSKASVVYTPPFSSPFSPLSYPFSSSLSSPHSPLTGSYKLQKLPPAVSSLFNVAAHSGKQLRQFKYSVHTLVVAMLSHKAFLAKVKCSTVYSSILQYIIIITVYSGIFQYITVYYNILQYTLVYYNVFHLSADMNGLSQHDLCTTILQVSSLDSETAAAVEAIILRYAS